MNVFGINSLKLAVSGLIIAFRKFIRIKQKSIYLVKVRSHEHCQVLRAGTC